ncbi:MAG TPA: DUF4215 domain-containing protein, partial [Kofleriaceae bacterium]|nr:DUF4215 domain-containing protein [Kofleriaceae bacterium]
MRTTKYLFNTMLALCLASPIACSFGGSTDESALSNKHGGSNSGDCTLTQGYWKNHPDAWPVVSLQLGTVTYTKVELIAILKTPVKGNGLVQLAHQLIAAKLNIAAGASEVDVKASIQAADALIGSLVCPPKGEGELATSATSSLTGKLDAFNSGAVGPGHCGDNDEGDDDHCDGGGHCGDDDGDTDDDDDHGGCDQPVCGNGDVETGEACDDGNTTNSDGCSSTCAIEVCVCGDGVKSATEACDDGNTTNGDGCSSTCQAEPGW